MSHRHKYSGTFKYNLRKRRRRRRKTQHFVKWILAVQPIKERAIEQREGSEEKNNNLDITIKKARKKKLPWCFFSFFLFTFDTWLMKGEMPNTLVICLFRWYNIETYRILEWSTNWDYCPPFSPRRILVVHRSWSDGSVLAVQASHFPWRSSSVESLSNERCKISTKQEFD